jgi:hypothetical protein
VLFLENEELYRVQQMGPFEMRLAHEYASASNYYSICHPSAPNYLSVTSGAPWQCGSDAVASYSTANLGELAQRAGLNWSGFFQSMPFPCDRSDALPYIAHHNPFIYYPDLYTNASLCAAHDQSFLGWNADVRANAIPNLAFFAPNMLNDGHDTSVTYADHWLASWLSPYLNASWFASSVWFVTYDEGLTNLSANGTNGGGHLFFAAVSPFSAGGINYTEMASHYRLLATIEWLLGLPMGGCSHNDSTSQPMAGLFRFPMAGEYPVQGTVTNASSGQPISNATVSLNLGSSTTTDALGNFFLTAPNGTYTISAAAPGYQDKAALVTVAGSSVSEDLPLPPTPTFPVTGHVAYASNGSAAAGVGMGLNGMVRTSTDSSGDFLLWTRNGTYFVAAVDPGWPNAVVAVAVLGSRVQTDLRLSHSRFYVTGFVTYANGSPAVGVSVRALPSNVTNTTISGGAYALQLPNGTAAVTFSATGMPSRTLNLDVNGGPVERNFTVPASGTPPTGGPPGPLGAGSLGWAPISIAVAGSGAVIGFWLGLRHRRRSADRGSPDSGHPG